MHEIPLQDEEFRNFQKLIGELSGINLPDHKKALLSYRLLKRVRHYELETYGQYYKLILSPGREKEKQLMLDLITTNETYFFREKDHFDFLRDKILPAHDPVEPLWVWSAACSSGEEAYSTALVLAEFSPRLNWRVLGSDISDRILKRARAGVYPMEFRKGSIPRVLLKKYGLRGVRSQEGYFTFTEEIRDRVFFKQVNLIKPLDVSGPFQVVFLRNALIYFNRSMQKRIIENIRPLIQPGGYLILGHSESLMGLAQGFQSVRPSIYKRTGNSKTDRAGEKFAGASGEGAA